MTLPIRVDNRMILPYRPDAHSVSDSLDNAWNGMVGKMELRATSLVWVDNVRIFPDVKKKSIHAHRLQLLPQSALSEVPGRGGKAMAGRARSRTAAGAVLPRGAHTAGADQRHRLPEQGRHLRPPVQGL